MGGVVSGAARVLRGHDEPDLTTKATAEEVQHAISISRKTNSFKNQKKAANSFLRLALNSDDIRDQIIEEGGLLPLIELFSSKSQDVQERCMLALSEFCKSEKCRGFVYENGGCVAMVEGVESKHSNVREASVAAIGSFSELEAAQDKLVEEGVCPGLLKLLTEEANPKEVQVLEILHRFSLRGENHTRMIIDECIETTFNVVHSSVKSDAKKALAIKVLAELCACKASHEVLYRLNGGTGVPRLVALIAGYNEDVAIQSAVAVARLTRSKRLSKQMVDEGVLPNLKRLLKSKSPAAALAALTALSALAQMPDHCAAIGTTGGFVLRAAKLCDSDAPAVELAAVRLLAHLAHSEANCPHIVSAGGHRALRRCAEAAAAPDEARAAAAEALGLLAHVVEAKRDSAVRAAVRRFRSLAGSGSPKDYVARPA